MDASLPSESSTNLTASPRSSLEHVDSIQPTTTATSSQHEHTDSMVTIRLSKAEVGAIAGEDQPPQNTEEATAMEHKNEEVESSREQTSELASRTDDEEITTRALSPDNDIVHSPVDAEDRLTDGVDMEQKADDASIRSSMSIMDGGMARQSSTLGSELERINARSRSTSTSSSKSSGSGNVDWTQLDKNEEREERGDGTDESMAFLLARLEQENNALATDPKAGISRTRSASRPPSMSQLKKLVSEPQKPSLRYSLLPSPPPMTELEFWTALVRNYPQTAQRLPTLTSNKIRNGIPPPLRGVVWQSIAGARDTNLEEEYERLSLESSPYEKLIHKDIGRSFPGVDMFRDPDGEGQKMLGKVLNAFSLYDQEIGYCQGLGFVVGPLLMHMGDKEAFCVLVRLLMHYDLRSCFLPDLSGLHLRIFQFQHLLSQHLPDLTAHLDKLAVEPLYLSQWFLSFFGVTCPLPMLIRIYDVILTEGASETLMRVALSLMRRNEKKILAATEFEDVMQLLLSRGLWDTYSCNADDLVQDFCDWTGLVTREKLQSLEENFKNNMSPTVNSRPSVHTAAARFLGRFWAGSGLTQSPKSQSPTSLAAPGRPTSTMRRTPSKQSMASTLNSIESAESAQTLATDGTDMSRQASGDWQPQKPASSAASIKIAPNKDKGLHSQIEDLLTALSDLQREHSQLASELQREREERDEDRLVVSKALGKLKEQKSLDAIPEISDEAGESASEPISEPVAELEERFTRTGKRSSLMLQTKQQLREEATRWKDRYNQEVLRTSEMSRQISEQERALSVSKDELRDARARIQDAHREKQRLEKTNLQLRERSRRNTIILDDNSPISPVEALQTPASAGGLREFKLGRTSSTPRVEQSPQPSPQFSKRISSLSTQQVLATEDHKPANEDALLLELVAAKTAETIARTELEEVKGKLDSLRKLLSGNSSSPGTMPVNRNSPPLPLVGAASVKEKPAATTSPVSAGAAGFFSGWGKRTASSGN